MEVARLEALYTANTSDFDRKSAQTDARFKQTAKEAANTEKSVHSAFRNPPSGLVTTLTDAHQRTVGLTGSMSSLRGIAAGVFAGFSASIVVSELQQAAAAVLRFKSNLETSEIAFTTMLGSLDLAQEHLRDLQRFALATPFEFEGLVDASKRMQAMGFDARQVIPILEDVGNAVASVGGSREVLDRVILALSQIQAKGKVSAQEMNQLAEAGIPAWRLLAESIGKSVPEVQKLAEEGKVSGAVFLEAFQKFSQANFGGMMERQSRTFAGAMSNIKDTLLQTAGTAFDPLFQQISQITDRVAQELSSGKVDIDTASQLIVDGLIETLGTAGGNAASSFIESFGRKLSDPSEWGRFVKRATILGIVEPLFKGIAEGLGDPEDLFRLGDPSGPITKAVRTPDLKSQLPKLTEQQRQVSAEAKKAAEIVNDLNLKLIFYGQTTETAATQQRLLAIGMEALTSAEGRRAIQLAQLIDKQRIANQLADSQRQLTEDLAAITEGKYKNAFDSLSAAIEAAVISTADLAASETGGLSELDRFNLGLGSQVQAMLETGRATSLTAAQIDILSGKLSIARKAFAALESAQKDQERRAERKRLGAQRTDLLRSLAGVDVDLNRQLRGTPSDEVQRLTEQLEGLSFLKINPGGLDLFVEKLRAGSLDAQTSIAEIRTALSAAAGDLGDELPGVTTRIVNLFLKSKELSDFFARDRATQRYADVLASLQEVIEGDVRLTNAQRIEKLLLSDAYKNLTEAQIESLRVTAQEADIAESLREREAERLQSMREVAEDLGTIFGDVFDSIGGDWRDMWQDLSRTARSISRQIMQDLFTGLFSKLFNIPVSSQSGGIIGAITNGIFNRGGGQSGQSGNTWASFGQNFPIPGRALGGPVEAGQLYRVNERGMEYFKPNIGGQVIPLGQQQQQSPVISRVAVFDDMRQLREWRPDWVVKKSNRKLGRLIPGFN